MAKLTDKEIAAYRYPDHKGRHADGGGLFLEAKDGYTGTASKKMRSGTRTPLSWVTTLP